jgi:hypothetical protein
MSFSDAFKKLSSMNPLEKVVSTGLGSLGKALGDKMASSGSDSSVVRKIASIASDALLSGASDEFFNFGGLTSRIGIRDLEISRFGNNHFSQVTPDGKMSAPGYQNVSYPSDLGEYFISFEIVDYQRPSPFVKATWNSRCTLNLPIPGALVEGHEVSWRDSSTGIIGALADAYAASQTAGADVDWEGVVAQGAINYGLNYISEDAFGAIGQIAGGIPNPNMSMFFQGPTFQEQTLQWVFAPQTPEESFLIKNMIQQFRIAMLPTASVKGSSNFLNYPKAVQMKLHAGDADAEHLFKMKKAVITNITANYSPNGHPQFFRGTKAPKYIDFRLHLKSIEYWLASDFDSTISSDNNWDSTLKSVGGKAKDALGSIFNQLGG